MTSMISSKRVAVFKENMVNAMCAIALLDTTGPQHEKIYVMRCVLCEDSLRKQAHSNILKIVPPKNEKVQIKIVIVSYFC